MIYLVSNNRELFKSDKYEYLSPEKAVKLLSNESLLGADTETEGMNPYNKKLLTIQLGTEEFQIVWDCTTVDIQLLKPILENPNIKTIWWNYLFDAKFLYHHRIIPTNIYDGMLAEKLMWLGYPPGMHSMSLKSAGEFYCGVELDKSIRGKIIQVGLTPDVIVYAAFDIKYEIPIYKKQLELLKEKDLLKASEFENEFVKVLAYIEYCGVKLDVDKWKAKMAKDSTRREKYKQELDDWVSNYFEEHKGTSDYIIEYSYPYIINGKIVNDELPENSIPIGQESKIVDGDKIVYRIVNIKFPFVKRDFQGDLFSGFDTKPKCVINWDSPKQVIPFFELLGFKLTTFDKKTKTKKKSVEANIIEPQKNVSPIAEIYLNYKAAQKVVSSYGENWLKAITKEDGRIHPSFFQLMDTGRLSCGGGESGVNVQNLPSDEETRACFVAEEGNAWISCDYKSQESQLIASISNDPAMLELFRTGCGDVHSLTAKMAYSDIIGDCPVEEIKAKFKHWRQEAKGIEFAINYGGDANTIANNKGIPLSEAQKIYDNYMTGFSGVKKYQDYCRKDVMQKGYILLSPVTRHKAYIYDFDELKKVQDKFSEDGFWQYYNEMKKFDPSCETVQEVKRYFKRKSASEKQAINYRIQGAGALCFKLASIKLFNWIKKNNLLFIVKYCVPVHDEINLECPKDISDEVAKILVKAMEEGAKPFCTRLPLGADVEVSDHWIH